jgi:very-short-patch-repair endonuclease
MSAAENLLELHLRAQKINGYEREYEFARPRKWRFDFAWVQKRIALEIEGAVWVNGRHTRGSGFVKDMEKYNAAALAGWKVFRVSTAQVRSGEALRIVERALKEGMT